MATAACPVLDGPERTVGADNGPLGGFSAAATPSLRPIVLHGNRSIVCCRGGEANAGTVALLRIHRPGPRAAAGLLG